MPTWSTDNLTQATAGHWLSPVPPDWSATGVSTDSRTLKPGELFVALRGERFDGHDHVAQAMERGAAACVVEHAVAAAGPLWCVNNTLTALQGLASFHRDRLAQAGCVVIAITGSSGKTTTRHLIHQLLTHANRRGSESPKSFNNHIGLPLTLLGASQQDAYVVCEVGMNRPGEIDALARIVRPDIAVISSIGSAHLAALGSREAIAREKAALLEHVREPGLRVIPGDEPLLSNWAPRSQTFGRGAACTHQVERIVCQPNGTQFYLEGCGPLWLPLLGEHNALNAAAAVVVARHLGVTGTQIAAGLRAVDTVPMRLDVRQIDGVTIINDAYNANPESTRAALAVLAMYADEGAVLPDVTRRVAVLGDMLELGDTGPALHREVGAYLTTLEGIDHAVFIGKLSLFTAEAVGRKWSADRYRVFPGVEEAAAALPQIVRPGDVVLLKASRSMRLERLLDALTPHPPVSPA